MISPDIQKCFGRYDHDDDDGDDDDDDDDDDDEKFDKMINAIKASDDIPGYSKVLWTV